MDDGSAGEGQPNFGVSIFGPGLSVAPALLSSGWYLCFSALLVRARCRAPDGTNSAPACWPRVVVLCLLPLAVAAGRCPCAWHESQTLPGHGPRQNAIVAVGLQRSFVRYFSTRRPLF